MKTVVLISALQEVGMIESAQHNPRPLSVKNLSSFEIIDRQRRRPRRVKVELVA
jgi:hypothetical protein